MASIYFHREKIPLYIEITTKVSQFNGNSYRYDHLSDQNQCFTLTFSNPRFTLSLSFLYSFFYSHALIWSMNSMELSNLIT